MTAPNLRVVDNKEIGRWAIVVHPVRLDDTTQRAELDITQVRGIPTVINTMTFTEPYGPAEATLTFPGITPLESIGFGSKDLWWLQPDMDIEIYWFCTDPDVLNYLSWVGARPYLVWEGFVSGFDWRTGQGDQVSITCTGAMRMLDNRVAQRVVASRPWPFERAIERAFTEANRRHSTRLGNLKIELLPSSPRFAHEKRYVHGKWYDKQPWYLRPYNLQVGEQWSGLLTRELGTWGKVLSDYITMLLKSMYTETGQYTLQLDPGRIPVLRHRNNTLQSIISDGNYAMLINEQRNVQERFDGGDRDFVQEWIKANHPEDYVDYRKTLIVDLTHPGVNLQLSADYSQSVTTIYGNVNSSLMGMAYDGMQFEGSGNSYWYEPFAKTPWVDSDQPSKVRKWSVRREVYDEFPNDLTPGEAKQQARRFLSINGSPGLIGNLSLESVDPTVYDREGEQITFPRQLVQANNVIRLDGFNGQRPGPLVYVNEATFNAESDSLSCQIDSKFRDFMTTAEVLVRGRDALLPNHTISVRGGYSIGVSDPILPWSYAKGCGYFPYGSKWMWDQFFANGTEPEFYEDWLAMTSTFKPRDYPDAYSKIRRNPAGRGKRSQPIEATYFWNVRHANVKTHNSKVLLSEAGAIMGTQFICVNGAGELMPVTYHLSVWNMRQANANNTPRIPSNEKVFPGDVVLTEVTKPNGKKEWMYVDKDKKRYYKKSSHYPFYQHAWFAQDEQTGKKIEDLYVAQDLNAVLYGVGNHYDRPGYWPGAMRAGDLPTGLWNDSTEWSYEFNTNPAYTDLYSATLDPKEIALCPVLIFCDDAPDEDLYFLGRFYKKPEVGR